MTDNSDNRKGPEKEIIPTSFDALSSEVKAQPPQRKAEDTAPRRPDMQAAPPPRETPTPAGGGTSFSDLAGEEELVAAPDESLQDDVSREIPDGEIDVETINARVLTESGARSRPYWIQAAVFGIIALVMFYGYLRAGGAFRWMSLGAGGITVFWALYGVYDEFDPRDRMLCGIGLIMGLVVVAGTLLF